MIPGMTGPVAFAGGAIGPRTFQQMIEETFGTSGLDFVLDAADGASYDGSSQTWVDTHSTNDFFRGATVAAEASDPTFNGVAGAMTDAEYFSFDGGDFFRETAAHTFAENWHKDNAAFTLVAVFWPLAHTGIQALFNTTSITDAPGLSWNLDASELLHLEVSNASAAVLDINTVGAISVSAWNFLAVALNEATGANGATLQIGATQSSFTSTYTAPSAAGSGLPYEIAGEGGTRRPVSGSRLACMAGWSRRLSDGELSALRSALQQRFSGI